MNVQHLCWLLSRCALHFPPPQKNQFHIIINYQFINFVMMSSSVVIVGLWVTHRCPDSSQEDQRRDSTEEKCPFLENSGSEEGVLQILQYMATLLGKTDGDVCALAKERR